MDYRVRQEELREAIVAAGVEALVVAAPANVRYLTGFVGEGLLLVGEEAHLSTDGRYAAEAGEATVAEAAFDEKGHWAGIAGIARQGGYPRVGFEAEHTTVAALEDLRRDLDGVELKPVRRIVEPLRVRKDVEEVEAIRRAARVTDQALGQFLAADCSAPSGTGCSPRSGPAAQSEKMAAFELLRLMLAAGAEGEAFETIVACGPGSAEPHHHPTDRTLEAPGPLKIDMGAKVLGYCADLTRTVCLGEPDDTFRRVYRAVHGAQQRALEAVKAGVCCRDVDLAARHVIEAAGLGDRFVHGVGHGVGIEVHESPRLGSTSEEILAAGSVVTVEPGVYIPGWGGVRIEDLVLVTEDGAEILSQAPKVAPDDL